jgi:hypothetical protein
MTKIKLDSEVVVSDPCYRIPTWCQVLVNDVKPGYYQPFMKKHDAGDWGTRNSMLMVIHEDHQFDDLVWEEHPGDVGVDSGQAGIFSSRTYRNDSHEIPNGEEDFSLGRSDKSGDQWYEKMCQRTLGETRWGVYDEGVVASSGFGDGSYVLYVAVKDRKIVALCIDFAVEEDEVIDFDFYKDHINA